MGEKWNLCAFDRSLVLSLKAINILLRIYIAGVMNANILFVLTQTHKVWKNVLVNEKLSFGILCLHRRINHKSKCVNGNIFDTRLFRGGGSLINICGF
jgi:hypothetical protein